MTLDEIRLRETVDLEDRIEEIEDELVLQLEEDIEKRQQYENEDSTVEPDPSNVPDVPVNQLEQLRDNLVGQKKACQRVVDALDDGEFVLQELMTSETAMLTDRVSEKQLDVDVQRQDVSANVKEGYHKVQLLQMAIVDWPESVENTEEDREIGREVMMVGMLPDKVSDYLYNCAVALNDLGEVDGVGNLQEYGVTYRNS